MALTIDSIMNCSTVQELHDMMSIYQLADPRAINNIFSNNLDEIKSYYSRIFTDKSSPEDRLERIEKFTTILKNVVDSINNIILESDVIRLPSNISSLYESVESALAKSSQAIELAQGANPVDYSALQEDLDSLKNTVAELSIPGSDPSAEIPANVSAELRSLSDLMNSIANNLTQKIIDAKSEMANDLARLELRIQALEDANAPVEPPPPNPK